MPANRATSSACVGRGQRTHRRHEGAGGCRGCRPWEIVVGPRLLSFRGKTWSQVVPVFRLEIHPRCLVTSNRNKLDNPSRDEGRPVLRRSSGETAERQTGTPT